MAAGAVRGWRRLPLLPSNGEALPQEAELKHVSLSREPREAVEEGESAHQVQGVPVPRARLQLFAPMGPCEDCKVGRSIQKDVRDVGTDPEGH